jgi:hypothetical protein
MSEPTLGDVIGTAAGLLDDLVGLVIEHCRAAPTKANHEALAALGEALARVRFVAAVFADAPQAPVTPSTPSTPPTPHPNAPSAARSATAGDAGT